MKLYFRLAAGGIRRNSRLYVPYIMTCSLMVMMYYITDALSGDECSARWPAATSCMS